MRWWHLQPDLCRLPLTLNQPSQNSVHHIFLAHFLHRPIQELVSRLVISWNCPLMRRASSTIWLASQPSGWDASTHRKQLPLPTLFSSLYVFTAKFCISVNSFTWLGSIKSWAFFQYCILHYLHCLFDIKMAIIFLIIFLCSTYMFPLAFLQIRA